jgi:hypothetical protein
MCVTFTYTRGKLTQCAMQFTKHLHEPIRQGKVNCSVRIWLRPHVKIGGRYRLGPGQIEVTAMREIAFADITPELARRSGFKGVVDLLKTAKHGRGSRVYLIEFRYVSAPSLKER